MRMAKRKFNRVSLRPLLQRLASLSGILCLGMNCGRKDALADRENREKGSRFNGFIPQLEISNTRERKTPLKRLCLGVSPHPPG